MLLYTRIAPPKVPKKRSRGGCTFCKEKKKKCDEERPACGRCNERGVECAYEVVRPRQRRKRDSIASSHPLNKLPRSPGSARALGEDERDSDDSYDDEEVPLAQWPSSDGQHRHQQHAYSYEPDDSAILSPLESAFDGASFASFPTPEFTVASPISNMLFDVLQEPEDQEGLGEAEAGELVRRHSLGGPVVTAQRGLFPELAMIAPCPVVSPLLDFSPSPFSEFSDKPNRRALVDHFCNVLSHLIVFREESGNPFQQLVLPLTRRNSPVMNAMFALAGAHLEYRGVENQEKSVFFHNQAIQGLAKQIEYGGPVDRNEILAAIILLVYYEVLVQRGRSNIVDGHLKGALTIMGQNSEPSDPTGVFLERAFRFYDVIAALSNGTAPLSAAPATGCLLPVPPLNAPEASSLSNVDTLLGMATTLWPIIHRLSGLVPLKAELMAAIESNAPPSKLAVLRTELESNAEAIEAALTSWKPNLPPSLVAEMKGTDSASSPGDKPAGEGVADEESHRMRSIVHNALAYRHSAFVYLYRTIYSWPRTHSLVQKHAHDSLTHCVATVSHRGPMGALLWPLFVGACEATSQEDRERAEKAFGAIEKRQGMMNIERAWNIVREVWRRADLEESGPRSLETPTASGTANPPGARAHRCRAGGSSADLWRWVSADMGVHIVFG
ncbi:hypothetical protein GQ53DRAFT_818059 [Thozetella sp. PMI_491]|nr:hypothetical protein GQ53DRAFT_818059 [Thozetella sp. PMI_491]